MEPTKVFPSLTLSQVRDSSSFKALSFTLHEMDTVDPETARRNGITKTRETIAQVRQRLLSSLDVY